LERASSLCPVLTIMKGGCQLSHHGDWRKLSCLAVYTVNNFVVLELSLQPSQFKSVLITMNYFPLIHFNMINLSGCLPSRLRIAAIGDPYVQLALFSVIRFIGGQWYIPWRLRGCVCPVRNGNTGLTVLSVSTKLCFHSEESKWLFK
jgi:hypothetical protein